jgi:hypothetical protein
LAWLYCFTTAAAAEDLGNQIRSPKSEANPNDQIPARRAPFSDRGSARSTHRVVDETGESSALQSRNILFFSKNKDGREREGAKGAKEDAKKKSLLWHGLPARVFGAGPAVRSLSGFFYQRYCLHGRATIRNQQAALGRRTL